MHNYEIHKKQIYIQRATMIHQTIKKISLHLPQTLPASYELKHETKIKKWFFYTCYHVCIFLIRSATQHSFGVCYRQGMVTDPTNPNNIVV